MVVNHKSMVVDHKSMVVDHKSMVVDHKSMVVDHTYMVVNHNSMGILRGSFIIRIITLIHGHHRVTLATIFARQQSMGIITLTLS
jgi:hypothetical protein